MDRNLPSTGYPQYSQWSMDDNRSCTLVLQFTSWCSRVRSVELPFCSGYRLHFLRSGHRLGIRCLLSFLPFTVILDEHSLLSTSYARPCPWNGEWPCTLGDVLDGFTGCIHSDRNSFYLEYLLDQSTSKGRGQTSAKTMNGWSSLLLISKKDKTINFGIFSKNKNAHEEMLRLG